MKRSRLIIIFAASAMVLCGGAFLVFRAPKPTRAEWTMILIASRTAGMASAWSSACSLNSRPLVETIRQRLHTLRIGQSERDDLVKQFAGGMTDVLSGGAPTKDLCDKLSSTEVNMINAVSAPFSAADFEEIAARLK